MDEEESHPDDLRRCSEKRSSEPATRSAISHRDAVARVAAATVAALIGRSDPVLHHRGRWEVGEGEATAGLEGAWRALGRPCRRRQQDAGLVESAGESGGLGAHPDGVGFLQRTQ
ncbi:hypothetical protein E2562_034708 [Oryza meyeriana var. granulata]|uniref:Uncharacterized protein n=1 Tax=Oryza meyeriana var. granulata TaxID=110450 RepID=A0A6G1CAK1_9ORYZ|nr:hypothetical protein E2562_034708 [Oryza meyeriana var. granulata]